MGLAWSCEIRIVDETICIGDRIRTDALIYVEKDWRTALNSFLTFNLFSRLLHLESIRDNTDRLFRFARDITEDQFNGILKRFDVSVGVGTSPGLNQ